MTELPDYQNSLPAQIRFMTINSIHTDAIKHAHCKNMEPFCDTISWKSSSIHQYSFFSNIPHMSNINHKIPSKEIKNNPPPPLSVSDHNSSSRLIVSERGVAFNKKTRYSGGAWVIQEINRTRHITDYLASHFHTERLPAVSISAAVSRQDFPVGPGREKMHETIKRNKWMHYGCNWFQIPTSPPLLLLQNTDWFFQISVISLAFV